MADGVDAPAAVKQGQLLLLGVVPQDAEPRVVRDRATIAPELPSAAGVLSWRSSNHDDLVAPTGFEPVIFALRGRCPRPLDEGAVREPLHYMFA